LGTEPGTSPACLLRDTINFLAKFSIKYRAYAHLKRGRREASMWNQKGMARLGISGKSKLITLFTIRIVLAVSWLERVSISGY
jgi:hypothetical protein